MCEEVNSLWGGKDSIAFDAWPEYNEELAKVDEVEIAVQINGKLRGNIEVTKSINKDDLLAAAREQENVSTHLKNKDVVKEIVVPKRLVNFVVK